MAKFKFTLSRGQFQNQEMDLEVFANEQKIETSTNIIEFDCGLPAKIEFLVSGKGEFDTLVDADGCIIEDKFIRIDSVTIDRMSVPKYLIESRLFKFSPIDSSRPSGITNYFAWNGSAQFDIAQSDSFEFFLDLYKD